MGKLTNTKTGEVTDYPGIDDPFELLVASGFFDQPKPTEQEVEESARVMRTIQERVRRAPSLPREAAMKVKQVLDPLQAKPHEEVGGGGLGYLASPADEAQRLDPELGQLPREDLEALVTAWAFDGVSILSVDQDGPRVIKRAQNAPGTEQLLRDLGINSEH
jgi:hypothetical protein